MYRNYGTMRIPIRPECVTGEDTESFSLKKKESVIENAVKIQNTAEEIIKMLVTSELTFGQSQLVLELVNKELDKKAKKVKVY